MDVLTKKGLLEPLLEWPKNTGHIDAQWTTLDKKAKATIRLHMKKLIFFTIMDHNMEKELWDTL